MAPRGGGAKWGGALPKLRILCPKTAFCGPKRPKNPVGAAKRRQTVATLHVRLDCPMNKSSFLPSGPTICPKRPKNGQKWPKCALFVSNTAKTEKFTVSWVAQNQVPRAPIPPAIPHFLRFPTLRIAQRDNYNPVPVVTSCSRRAARPTHSWGQRWVHQGPRGEKKIFSKSVPRPLGMLKQVFLGRFQPWWRVRAQNAFKRGRCKTNNWSKMGEKCIFPKLILDHLGCSNKCFLAHFEAVVTRSGPWKIPECLKNGSFCDQKWVKNGAKVHVSRSDPGSFGMLKQEVLAHFEPNST